MQGGAAAVPLSVVLVMSVQ